MISDANTGLKAACRKILEAEWQRCKVHFFRNALAQVPKSGQAKVGEAMKTVFVQRNEKSARLKADELLAKFRPQLSKAVESSRLASATC